MRRKRSTRWKHRGIICRYVKWWWSENSPDPPA